jgi:hypothetical protein
MMSSRVHPLARLRVYEAGPEPRVRYPSFGQYDVAGDIMQDPATLVSPVDPGQLGLWEGNGYPALLPGANRVPADNIGSVICRPFADTSQAIGLGHFQTVGGTWEVLHGLGLNQEVKLYQSDGTSNLTTGLVSRFDLPHNPMFALSLYRAEPGPDHDWAQPPFTEIHFGIRQDEEWAIVLPYTQSLEVLRRTPDGWRTVPSRKTSAPLGLTEGHARGQRMVLWVAVLRHTLALSTDGFQRHVWTYEDIAPAEVKSGKFAMWHNAGEWLMSFMPVKMTPAVVYRAPIETGMLTRQSSGPVVLEGRMIPVCDDDLQILSTPIIIDDTLTRAGLSETERSWKVQLNPFRFRQEAVGTDPDTGEPVDFETWLSPEWLSAQMGQAAEVTTPGESVYTDLSADAVAVTGEHAADRSTAKYRVALDNQQGQHRTLPENRRTSLALGWRMSDGTEALGEIVDGHLVEPPVCVAAGGMSEVLANVLDPMLRLRDEKADGRTPVFDGWDVYDVFRWVLVSCGIPESQQDLEDLGTVMSTGTVEEPAWRVEPGRSWVEFLQQVAQFDHNAAIYFDEVGAFRKTCPYCRQKRTAADVTSHDGTLTGGCENTVRWELYTRARVAPDSTAPGEVLALRRTRRSLAPEEYSNYVVVCGVDEDGRPLRATAFDAASLYDPASDRYVGWRKMDVTTVLGYTTADAVQRLATERLQELSAKPEHVMVVTPLLPEVRIGQVIRIHGGETAGVTGELYRVQAVRHEVRRRPRQVATTTIEGRVMG